MVNSEGYYDYNTVACLLYCNWIRIKVYISNMIGKRVYFGKDPSWYIVFAREEGSNTGG